MGVDGVGGVLFFCFLILGINVVIGFCFVMVLVMFLGVRFNVVVMVVVFVLDMF